VTCDRSTFRVRFKFFKTGLVKSCIFLVTVAIGKYNHRLYHKTRITAANLRFEKRSKIAFVNDVEVRAAILEEQDLAHRIHIKTLSREWKRESFTETSVIATIN
jgi:hypothetical protein